MLKLHQNRFSQIRNNGAQTYKHAVQIENLIFFAVG